MHEKLYYTCKIWGFVKYYHSEVSVCNVNWDSVLIDVLPDVRAAGTNDQFNDALMRMLDAAGPMALSTTYFPDTLAPELKRNRDFSWFSSTMLRADVRTVLDTIRNNFRPHPNCWVINNTYTTPYVGWLVFPYDSVGINVNTTMHFPSSQDSLSLMFFKQWNIVRYFNPYNYVLDTSWDATLFHFATQIQAASDAHSLYLLYLKIAKRLDDAHVYSTTYNNYDLSVIGFYKPYIQLKFVEGEYVVTKSMESGIYKGDLIKMVDGLTMPQWEDSLRPYYSAGSLPIFRRMVCNGIIARKSIGIVDHIVIQDSLGGTHPHYATCKYPYTIPGFFSDRYPADSLTDVKWTTLNCDIGYINMGNVFSSDVATLYDALRSKEAIIVDMRHSANSTFPVMLEKFSGSLNAFVKSTIPDVNYPGTFYWDDGHVGSSINPHPYGGKVILLIDEFTQSHSEYTSMAFETLPDVVKVGSQTAGADGNVTFWKLSRDIDFGFTSLGIYYPNGDSTQRIGIVPDTVAYPTILGIRRNRDEVLEKAMTIAGCNIFTPVNTPTQPNVNRQPVSIYPNPANETITITINGNNTSQLPFVTITNVSGKVMQQTTFEKNVSVIDIHTLPPGMYFVTVRTGTDNHVTKLVKE